MATQLGFDLPVRPALGRDAFLVAPSNSVALAMIDDWPNWPRHKLVLTGPAGAGKTHLAHVWADASGARIMDAASLANADIETLAQAPCAVEDVDRIASDLPAQTALFHLHNLIAAEAKPLMLTGTASPRHWRLTLPDLQSRVDAAGHARLDAPDDTLLAAVLAKLFFDRQTVPRPDVIPFLLRRIDRSFAAARDVVAALDARSLAQKRPVTRALAAEVLDNPSDASK